MAEVRRRSVLLALAGGALAGSGALAGCARIPRSGPVRAGGVVIDQDQPGYRVEPVGPVAGASPVEVVRGFLLAGVGVDDDFRTAREFLAAPLRATWRPTARTVVHPQATLEVVATTAAGVAVSGPDGADGADIADGAENAWVRVATAVTAEVDPAGRYRPAPVGERLDVVLTLLPEDGQWRISQAPDQLLLDDSRFSRTFAPRSVVFAARGSDPVALVPDARWLLDRPSAATTLVEQVLAGPPSWLAPAVTSGAPGGTALPTGSVTVSSGVALVDLPSALQRQRTAALRQLQQQLSATLRGLGSSVTSVRVSVDGGDLPPTAVPDLDAGFDEGAIPLVLIDGVLARLVNGALLPLADLPSLPGASHPAVRGDQVAVLLADRSQLQRLEIGDAAALAAPVPLGADLTPPSVDSAGWAWSTPAACTGTVSAVGRDGSVVAVAAPWLEGRRVVGLRVAPDGARALVSSTGSSGQPDAVRVDVAGVARAADGTPQGLTADTGAPSTPWLQDVLAAVWIGPTTVAVLGTSVPGSGPAVSASVSTQQVAGTAPTVWLVEGGRVTDLGGPPPEAGAVGLAGSAGRQSLVVSGADGRLWPREGSRWLPLGVTGTDPAYPG